MQELTKGEATKDQTSWIAQHMKERRQQQLLLLSTTISTTSTNLLPTNTTTNHPFYQYTFS